MDRKKQGKSKPKREYPDSVKYDNSDVELKEIVSKGNKRLKLSNVELFSDILK